MVNRSFKAQVLSDNRRRPGLLVAAWVGSMVLVALVAVFLTDYLSDDGRERPDVRATPPVAEAQPETPTSSRSSDERDEGDEGDEGESDGIVESSPDTVIESEQASDVAASDTTAADDSITEPTSQEDSGLPQMRLAGAEGLVPMPMVAVSKPPTDRVAQWCQELADQVSSVDADDCMNGAFRDSGRQSVEGRPMVVRDMPASSGPAMGRVLLLSATHGDEPSSIGTVFRWMDMMARDGTPYEWHIVPTLNPDGALHQPATRVNANGVDLNRNLPTNGWATESRDYWRRVGFEKRRFPGESAGSEPENQWLAEEIQEFQPNVIISLHAPYGVLDYDGSFPPPEKLGRLNLHRLGVYPGSLGNFASHMRGIPVITVELSDAREPPNTAEVQRMWSDLNGWLDRYLRSVRQAKAGTQMAPDAG